MDTRVSVVRVNFPEYTETIPMFICILGFRDSWQCVIKYKGFPKGERFVCEEVEQFSCSAKGAAIFHFSSRKCQI
jgi:hypothetical protein